MEKAVYRHIRKLEKKLGMKKGGRMESLKEAVKEGLRVVVLAVIPVAILGLENGNIDIKALAVVGLVAFLRAVDSWLHESGKAEGGLTRF